MPMPGVKRTIPNIKEPPSKVITRIGFVDGVKPAYNPIATPRTAIWEGRNVDVDDVGILRLRPGSLIDGASAGSGGAQGGLSAFGTMVMAWHQDLYKLVGGAWTEITGSDGVLSTGAIDLLPWSESGSQVVYVLTGKGLGKTTATSYSALVPHTPGVGETNLLYNAGVQDVNSVPYKARIGLMRPGLASRMAVAYGNDICLSYPNDPTWWPSDQVIHLPDDGDQIVALSLYYDALIIYRQWDIWAFFGAAATDTSARLVRQYKGTGCRARRSIAQVPGMGEVFLGQDNIYALTGVTGVSDQVQVAPAGNDVAPYVRQCLASVTPENASGIFFDREYRLCFPNAVQPERVFRLKAGGAARGWYIDDGPRASQYFIYSDSLYAASPDYGKAVKISRDYRNDDGQAIPFFAAFAHENFGVEARIKRLYLYVTGSSTLQHVGASVIADGRAVQTTELAVAAAAGRDFGIGVSYVGGPDWIGRLSDMRLYEGRLSLKGNLAQVQVSASTPDEEIGIVGYALEIQPTDRIRGIRDGVS